MSRFRFDIFVKRMFSLIFLAMVIATMSYVTAKIVTDDSVPNGGFTVQHDGDSICMAVNGSVPEAYDMLDANGNVTNRSFCYLQDKKSGGIYKFSYANMHNIWFELLKNDDGSNMTKAEVFAVK